MEAPAALAPAPALATPAALPGPPPPPPSPATNRIPTSGDAASEQTDAETELIPPPLPPVDLEPHDSVESDNDHAS